MSEMVTRVALASFECWRKRMTEKGRLLDVGQTFEDMSESEREFSLLHARAMIEAMREPTLEMKLKGVQLGLNVGPDEAAEVWQDMIDAALKPGGAIDT